MKNISPELEVDQAYLTSLVRKALDRPDCVSRNGKQKLYTAVWNGTPPCFVSREPPKRLGKQSLGR